MDINILSSTTTSKVQAAEMRVLRLISSVSSSPEETGFRMKTSEKNSECEVFWTT